MKKAIPLAISALLFVSLSFSVIAQQTGTVASSIPKAEPGGNPAPATNSDAQRLYDSGLALSQAGKIEEAINALKQSLKIRPEDPQTHFQLGMNYSKSKSYKEAFDSFKRATHYKPNWAEAHFRLGMMSYVLGRKSQSVDEYRRLVELKSPYANILQRIIQDENATGTAEVKAISDDSAGTGNALKNTNSEASAPKEPAASGKSNVSPAANSNAPVPAANNPVNKQPIESAKSNAGPAANSNTPAANSPINKQPGPTAAANEPAPKTTPSDQRPPTEIYRIGVGDILDVRLLNSATNRSTLFTVIGGGVIDLPIAGGSIAVAGLTADEIQARISAELKRRAVEEGARVSVGVRQYASHTVTVTGFVASPGTRYLRREAVPLYVVLAECQLRNDAGRAMILRGGVQGQPLDLSDPATLNTTVVQGDIISVTGRPQEFYYIAGRINYPGQKPFQAGITLLQAILAAGGTPRNENKIEISRAGSDGRLVTTKFSIKELKAGKVADPKLQPGDRIEVLR
jgi:protein involved in polysaccharide export with SLBB domain